jgi:hypothetical protein
MHCSPTKNMKAAENKLLGAGDFLCDQQKKSDVEPVSGFVYVIMG